MNIRLSRAVTSDGSGTYTYANNLASEFVVSVDLPYPATEDDVAAAAGELLRLAPMFAPLCPGCGTKWDTVHRPECPLAPEHQIDLAWKEAFNS